MHLHLKMAGLEDGDQRALGMRAVYGSVAAPDLARDHHAANGLLCQAQVRLGLMAKPPIRSTINVTIAVRFAIVIHRQVRSFRHNELINHFSKPADTCFLGKEPTCRHFYRERRA